jgi:tetratricopeptide (TPR) repeat protein
MRCLPHDGGLVNVRRATLPCAFCATLAALSLARTSAAAEFDVVENIIITRTQDTASVRILTACRVQYESHAPSGSGIELRIAVRPDEDCALPPNAVSRTYRPVGRELGRIDEVAVDFEAGDTWFVTLHFTEAVHFDVQPHPAGWLQVAIETSAGGIAAVAQRPPPLPSAADETRGVRPGAGVPAAGRAGRVTARFGASVPADEAYVMQLGVFADVGKAVAALGRTEVSGFAYTTSFDVNGREWHALQVGFFATEAAAGAALQPLTRLFPDAWVRLVEPAERADAEQDGALDASTGAAIAIAAQEGRTADESALEALLEDASGAIVERRYDDAVDAYTQVLQVPAHPYRAEAREYVAVALERQGETAKAIAEYEAWLDEFGHTEGAARVAARLAGLAEPERSPARASATSFAPQAKGWTWYGGVSQYYWRNEEQLVNDGNHIVSSSGVLSLADVTVTSPGERFDLLARMNGAYQVDLIEYDGQDNTGWVTNAYLDLTDRELGWRGRVGRQARRQEGVLGRFDGVSVDYALRPGIGLGISAGLPVDSPRYRSGSHRSYVAASARLDELRPDFALNVYAQRQVVDGISDREAIGAEAQYLLGDVALVGVLDYDLSYGALNLALLNAQWRLPTGWTMNVRAETGMQPFLTTRNALAGQGVSSVEALLDSYTEGQVRTLARDRWRR